MFTPIRRAGSRGSTSAKMADATFKTFSGQILVACARGEDYCQDIRAFIQCSHE
jgi:hypothetical protein